MSKTNWVPLKPTQPSPLASTQVDKYQDLRLSGRPMITKHDLMKTPENVQPLGSVKGVLNKPTELNTDLNIRFNSRQNLGRLHKTLYAEYCRDTNAKKTEAEFAKFFLEEVKNFKSKGNLNQYVTAEYQATGYNNYHTALEQINMDFMAECRNHFPYQTFNPFKADYLVGSLEEKVLKKGFDLSHEDVQTLDVWRSNIVNSVNRHYRENNQIPVYRHSLHMRHVDRSNEGLRDNNPDRASLENFVPQRYDMGKIEQTHLNYKEESWYEPY